MKKDILSKNIVPTLNARLIRTNRLFSVAPSEGYGNIPIEVRHIEFSGGA